MQTQLQGLFPPTYTPSGRVNLSELMRTRSATSVPSPQPDTHIRNARELQSGTASDHAFLEQHGFVLLTAPTAVEDWSDPAVAALYNAEVDALIRTKLYPDRNLIVTAPSFVVRRGAGTDNPQYAGGVHQDHGTTADDYQHNAAAFVSEKFGRQWRERFDREDVDAFITLDFWRTTNMAGPLKHMPLVLCDPSTLDAQDIIPTAFEGIAPHGAITHHVGLRRNDGQRWYYYPDMSPEEVLVFKLFDLRPGEQPSRYRACFHSAVADPATPPDAEPRQSCEHRVGVMLLK